MTKRFVIEGAPGSAKTTVLVGHTHFDKPDVQYRSLRDRGFVVVPESAEVVIDELEAEGKDLLVDVDDSFKRVFAEEIRRFRDTENEEMVFFDRALPGFELPARRYHARLPETFPEQCRILRYTSPIFLFRIIEDYDLSKPLEPHKRDRIYTVEERLERHSEIKACYEKWGYDVVEVPVFSKDPQESIDKRIDFILDAISAK